MTHPHALDARARKAEVAAAMRVDDAMISSLVEAFYARVRADALIGPVFADKIADWGPHLARMKDFWSSVAIESGRFRGNPMVKHLAIPGLNQLHFDRWLALFDETLADVAPTPEAAEFFSERAARIAESLMLGITLHTRGLGLPARTPSSLPGE